MRYLLEICGSLIIFFLAALSFSPKDNKPGPRWVKAITWGGFILLWLGFLLFKGISGQSADEVLGKLLANAFCATFSTQLCEARMHETSRNLPLEADSQISNSDKKPQSIPHIESAPTSLSNNRVSLRAPIACEDYRLIAKQEGRSRLGTCNNNTGIGYYWEIIDTPMRPYGFYGLVPSKETPNCKSDRDIGKTGETATFDNSPFMWDVKEYYCRGNGPYGNDTKCAIPDESGQTYDVSNPRIGVFRAFCRKQT